MLIPIYTEQHQEERTMSLKSVASKTCVWCVAITVAALTLLAVTWTVILVSN